MLKKNKLKNKTIIITGANRGIGFELSKHFLKCGSNLILLSRSKKQNQLSKKKLLSLSHNKNNLFFQNLDISNFREVDKFFKRILLKYKKIDILINNAGIYGPKGPIDKISWKQLKKTIDVNLLGSIYFIKKILPHFKKNKYGRIIQLSGGGATSAFPNFSPYSISKTAIVRFVENVSKEIDKFNISINAIAPGPVNTRMLDEVIKAGPKKVGNKFYLKSLKQKKEGGTNIKKIVELIEFLINLNDAKINGKLISAVWDNWKNYEKNKKIIMNSDVGNLRRISGKDRKLSFLDK